MLRPRAALAFLGAGALGAAVFLAPGANALPRAYTPQLVDPALRALAGPDSGTFPGAEVEIPDVDHRGPTLAPAASALAALAALGSDTSVSWTQFGTPRTLVRQRTWLATGLTGTPAEAARSWIVAHADLFGLTDTSPAALETWIDDPLTASTAHAVMFRQHVGGRALVQDGLITVGIRDGNIASVTSSAVPTALLGTSIAAKPTISTAQAVLAAATDAGVKGIALSDITAGGRPNAAGFDVLAVKGLKQSQLTRLRALPTTDRGARLVYETDITDVAAAHTVGVISDVDALTGDVLYRHDAVQTAEDASAGSISAQSINLPDTPIGSAITNSSGTITAVPGSLAAQPAGTAPTQSVYMADFTPAACGMKVTITVPEGDITLAVSANATVPTNDIALNVYRNGKNIGSSDEATSPEAVTATLSPAAAATDVFQVEICPSTAPIGPFTAPYSVAGTVTSSSASSAAGLPSPPTWLFFQSNPTLPVGTTTTSGGDTRALGCGASRRDTTTSKGLSDCKVFFDGGQTPASYDVQLATGLPTFTSIGNNATTTNAQASDSLTAGAGTPPPTSVTRDYGSTFTDSWHTTACDPTTITGTSQADVNAAINNLFVGHNRIHDFAFRLGLNDLTGDLQTTNANQGVGVPADPETGNAQNAAASDLALRQGGPIYAEAGIGLTGRNNANQITMQDGVPGITNQYLFEPVLGFYGPCADGDLDSSIFLHEYTHAISNRLIAGPDTGLSGQQGGSMGESWSDLDAIEFLNAFGVAGKTGEDRYAEGAYATGDRYRGIRDYNLNNNPLTYGEFGFDTTGPEVHADGEIWNGIQMHVRQSLIDAYVAKDPTLSDTNVPLETACALGVDAAGAPASGFEGCPGDRRWIQYVYDSLILQANGAPTFVDMKNTELAGAMLRNSTADYKTMADEFANRGLGMNSSSTSSADTDPVPGFASPTATNAHVTFSFIDDVTGASVPAYAYVGTYTARATPLASDIAMKQPSTADMVAGDYSFVVQASGYGLQRFTASYTAGQTVSQVFRISKNFASAGSGATVVGDGSVRPADLIDDSEATDTGYNTTDGVKGKSWTVALGGGSHVVQRISVSAMHHPVDTTDSADFQSRITDLRAFDIQASSDGGKTYSTVYSSADDFFPAKAPRTLAPDVDLRSVTLAKPVTADHLRLVVRTSQCTGSPDFAGNHTNDTLNNPDCPSSASAPKVTVAEFEAFGPAPLVAVNPGGGTTTTKPGTTTTPVAKVYRTSSLRVGGRGPVRPAEKRTYTLRVFVDPGAGVAPKSAGRRLGFYVNGKLRARLITGKDGTIKYTLKFPKGNYVVSAVFYGDTDLRKSTSPGQKVRSQ